MEIEDDSVIRQNDLASRLRQSPADLAVRVELARILSEAGKPDRAIEVLAEGARHHAGSPELAGHLAQLLTHHGRHGDAQLVLRAGLRACPGHLPLRGLLAAELAADLQGPAARHQIRSILATLPDQSAPYGNLAVVCQSLGCLDEAIRLYRRALQVDPGNSIAEVNLATSLLTKGDFVAGFRHFERRLELPELRLPPIGLRRWRGEPIEGRRVLVTAEQGFGDVLQYARFLPRLCARAATVWLECPLELQSLMREMPGLAGIIGPGDRVPEIDVTVPLLSLPHLLAEGGDLLAETVPYLTVPAGGTSLAEAPRPKIGLIWRGRAAKGELFVRRSLDRRSCALIDLAPLWQRDRYQWYSLQLDARPSELGASGLIDLAPLMTDFKATARLMQQLDLVISIDTAGAHLAAALGCPLWVLLAPGQSDYRWNGISGQSPWYPAVRLLRADHWPALARQAASELALVSWEDAI